LFENLETKKLIKVEIGKKIGKKEVELSKILVNYFRKFVEIMF